MQTVLTHKFLIAFLLMLQFIGLQNAVAVTSIHAQTVNPSENPVCDVSSPARVRLQMLCADSQNSDSSKSGGADGGGQLPDDPRRAKFKNNVTNSHFGDSYFKFKNNITTLNGVLLKPEQINKINSILAKQIFELNKKLWLNGTLINQIIHQSVVSSAPVRHTNPNRSLLAKLIDPVNGKTLVLNLSESDFANTRMLTTWLEGDGKLSNEDVFEFDAIILTKALKTADTALTENQISELVRRINITINP